MAVGQLLQKLTGKDKTPPKMFLALVLTEEIVQAAIWQVEHEQTEVVALGTVVEWDGEAGTSNELVTAVDATIASATEGINGEINEVILGVPYSWTDSAGIVGSKRELIKKINHELELKPLGYVSLTDSVLTYLKMQEGSPATTILVQITKKDITIVLVRLGRIEGITVEMRKENIAEVIVEGITKIGVGDNLPTRFILFDNMHNLDEIAQELMQIPWQKHFAFLHLPKIETLPKDVTIRSVALAGGSEVARSLGFVSEEAKPEEETEEAGEEVASREQTGESENKEEFLSEEEIGFGVEEKETVEKEVKPKREWKMPKITLPSLNIPKISLGKWGVIGGIFLLILILFGWGWWSIPRASITATVMPEWIDQEVSLTLTTDTNSSVAGLSVPATIESTTVSGEKMIDTTGTKIIGDKASGEVTIYNRTDLNKTFTKGTVLTAPGGIKFSLDADVAISSKSAGVDYVDVPGKATVKVSASAIGSESNLAANTELTVASFDKVSYVAKNETAFSGGTSQEIQVVAKDDYEVLTSELKKELVEQLKTNPSYLIVSSIKTASEEYTAKIGEEAKSVGLNMSLTASLLSYQNDDVKRLVEPQIQGAVPPGYSLAQIPVKVELTADSIDEEGSSVTGVAKVQIALLPTYDQGGVTRIIAGKTQSEVKQIIQSQIAGVDNLTIKLQPTWWINKSGRLPRNSSRIELTLQPSET